MIQRIIFYVILFFVAVSFLRAIYDRLHPPGELPDMPMPVMEASKEPTAKTEASTEHTGNLPDAGTAKIKEDVVSALKAGIKAKTEGDLEKAGEQFREGFKLAKQLNDKQMIQVFVASSVEIYLHQNKADMAAALLEVAKDQGDIDEVFYHTQRVALYEAQGKNEDMCGELETLKGLLLGLSCDTYEEEVKIFLEGSDKARIMKIMQGKDAPAIADCVGKYAVNEKFRRSACVK